MIATIKLRFYVVLLVVIVGSVENRSALGADDPPWIVEFREVMERLPDFRLYPEMGSGEFGGVAILSDKLNFRKKYAFKPDEAVPGVEQVWLDTFRCGLQLWLIDEKEYLLLAWHRDQSRARRTFVCALFLCNRIDILREPYFGRRTDFEVAPERYAEPEATERQEELEYVKANAPAIAGKIHEALSEYLAEEKVAGFAYTAQLSPENHAQLLSDAAKAEALEQKGSEQMKE